VSEHIIGFIRVILPRYTEAGQRQAMEAHSIQRILQEGGKRSSADSMDTLLRMLRPDQPTTVAVLHALLLANPRDKRKKGGTRAAFWRTLDAIEKRGGVIWELYTGLRTDTREGRDKMTREAIDALARGRHKTSQSDKRGRPPKQFTDAQWEKAKAAWDAIGKLKTWDAVAKKLPKGMTPRDCWNRWGARSSETDEET
jgi:hypothetical protein